MAKPKKTETNGSENDESNESDDESEPEDGEMKSSSQSNGDEKSLNSTNEQIVTEETQDGEMVDENEITNNEFTTPVNNRKKRKILQEEAEQVGNVSIKISGTPILQNVSGVDQVPSWEKFSVNICDHRAFEMDANAANSTGHFKKILQLTRNLKSGNQSTSP